MARRQDGDEYRDERRPSFCFQTHAALDAIRGITGERVSLPTARSIYVALTEAANRVGGYQAREGFRFGRKELAALAGVSRDTLDRHLPRLEEVGVLRIERRQESGVHLPHVYVLTDPEPVAASCGGWPHDAATGGRMVGPLARASDVGTQETPSPPAGVQGKEGELVPLDDVARVYGAWRLKRRKTSKRYDEISPARRKKIEARLREFSVVELFKALDGVCADEQRWPERAKHDDLTVVFRSREQVDRFIEIAEAGSGPGRALSPEEIVERYGRAE